LFQSEAPGDGDGVATGVIVEGEPPGAEEAVEAQTQVDALVDNAKAVMETEKPKV
jgi:hypothetical protein